MIENGILYLKGYYEPWKMEIDLNELIKTTNRYNYCVIDGKTVREIITKKSEARRILKFVIKHASLADFEQMDLEFRKNDDLMKIWLKLRGQE